MYITSILTIEGVMKIEKRYKKMAEANGIDPLSNSTVDFHISNFTYAESLEKVMLRPLAFEGIDFWWTDWQQGLGGLPGVGTLDVTGLNPTIWLNHLRFMNYTGSNRRGHIHSRFGGLGNHRYIGGFGGDVVESWESLPALIYTTVVATNVLFCYWGQEMMSTPLPTDFELFTRTMQFGAWSPVFTTWGNDRLPNNIWTDRDFPEPYREAARTQLENRAVLLPYRYTLSYIAHKSSLGMLRPMYYDYPFLTEAYTSQYFQYMLGDALLVSPAYTKIVESTSVQSIWFPPHQRWLYFANGTLAVDGTIKGVYKNISSALDYTPVFVKAGTVLPCLPSENVTDLGRASKPYYELEWWIYPRFNHSKNHTGNTFVYEDDGMSNDYLNSNGGHALIMFDYEYTNDIHANNILNANDYDQWCFMTNISYAGNFSGESKTRKDILKFINTFKIPSSATVDNIPLTFVAWQDNITPAPGTSILI